MANFLSTTRPASSPCTAWFVDSRPATTSSWFRQLPIALADLQRKPRNFSIQDTAPKAPLSLPAEKKKSLRAFSVALPTKKLPTN